MIGLVLFVVYLVNFHATNSFSLPYILEGTWPVTTDLYQNHQTSVIEQQAALLVLAEKERENLAVFDLHTHMLEEMLIAVMILVWVLLQCGGYKIKSTTCDGPQLSLPTLKHIAWPPSLSRDMAGSWTPPPSRPPGGHKCISDRICVVHKRTRGEKKAAFWILAPSDHIPPLGWLGWDAWLNQKSHGSGL